MTQVVNIEVAEKTVALPVDKKILGDFISGLLGQPQTLEQQYDAAFSVDHRWFVHFFSLILQRIQQQNAPEPLAFEAQIQYRNKLERKITSWQAFQHFSETQNIVSTRVKFRLALLIHFPSKSTPERQELIFSFDSCDTPRNLFEVLVGAQANIGRIFVEIRHTERTWADDILRLIETELSCIKVAEGKLKKFLRKVYFPVTIFSFPLSLIVSIIYTEWGHRSARAAFEEKALEAIQRGTSDLQSLHAKVDILLATSTSAVLDRSYNVKILIYSLLVTVFLIFAGIFLAKTSPSFVVLSQAAEKNRTDTLERLKRKNFWLLISMFGSIAIGVIGNFVYDSIK